MPAIHQSYQISLSFTLGQWSIGPVQTELLIGLGHRRMQLCHPFVSSSLRQAIFQSAASRICPANGKTVKQL
jgi:hypothetical protein